MLKFYEFLCGGYKLYFEMEKFFEFVGVEYEELKGFYVVVKKDLKVFGEWFNFFSDWVDEMVIEIDNLV